MDDVGGMGAGGTAAPDGDASLPEVERLIAQAGECDCARDLDGALKRWLAVVAILEREREGTLQLADALEHARDLCAAIGQATDSLEYAERVVSLYGTEAPGSLQCADAYECLGHAHLDLGHLDEAAGHYRRALRLTQSLAPDSLELAERFQGLGNVALDRGEYVEAERMFERAREVAERRAPGSEQCANAYTGLGHVRIKLNDFAAAREHYRAALMIQERAEPDSLSCAGSYQHLGNIELDCGDPRAALALFERQLGICARIAPESEGCAAAWDNMGLAETALGRIDDAVADHLRAVSLRERIAPDSPACANSYNNLANAYTEQGDLRQALAHYSRAASIAERTAPGSLDCAECYQNVGNVHFDRGDLGLALSFYERALAIWEREAPGTLGWSALVANIANVHQARGDTERAVEALTESLRVSKRTAPRSMHTATALYNLGRALIDSGAPREVGRGWDCLRRAASLQKRLAPLSTDYGLTLTAIGQCYLSSARWRKALHSFEQSARVWQAAAPSHVEHARALAFAGYSLGCLERWEDALVAYEDAMDILDGARSRSADSDDRAAQAGFALPHEWIYRDAIELHLDDDQPLLAMDVAERMRAATLRQALLESTATVAQASGAAVMAEREELIARRDELEARRGQALAARNVGTAIELEAELGVVWAAWSGLVERARREAPEVAAMLFPEACGDGPGWALPEGAVALSYVLLDAGLWALLLEGSEVSAYDLGGSKESLDWVYPSVDEDPSQGAARVLKKGRELWDTLIAPVWERIRGKRVLVCPDGPLHFVPFAALTDELGTPLGESCPLVMLQSVDTLRLLRQRHAAPSVVRSRASGFLGVGDPVYSDDDDVEDGTGARSAAGTWSARETMAREGHRWTRLPHTAREVLEAASALGSNDGVLLREEASEPAVRAAAPSARYLHFACHGYYNNLNPLDSGLVLSQVSADPEDPSSDGYLTAEELLGLRLDADLVVLSACETGVGASMGGEGLVGLTRAVMFAGAPSVMCSLWRVDDASTARFMARFYGYLSDGHDKAEALRLAQRWMRTEAPPAWRSPEHWAGFVLWGDWA